LKYVSFVCHKGFFKGEFFDQYGKNFLLLITSTFGRK